MKTSTKFLIVGALMMLGSVVAGCATTPRSNPWTPDLKSSEDPATLPLELPEFPEPIMVTSTTVTYDVQGAHKFDEYRVVADANTEIAYEHADQIDALREKNNHLVDAGASQRRIADMRQEILEEERRAHMYSKFGNWIIMIVLGVAAAR